MQDLINRLKEAGLSDDQAKKAITVISDFVGEKFPMIKGYMGNLLGDEKGDNAAPQVGGINLSGLG